MNYKIHYSCLSHIGNIRRTNQDNFICDGRYMESGEALAALPVCGIRTSAETPVFGIFDGMGGEECGEVASYIAAKAASEVKIGEDPVSDLSQFCHRANMDICDYAEANGVPAMGTTAAILAFTCQDIILCNIGDSKIFRLRNGVLEQISVDHIAVSVFGMKPPLLQNLGIPPSELVIEPYLAREACSHGDVYLICSDGLTDMVPVEEIAEVLVSKPVSEAASALLDKALLNGGRDNTTIILCKIERQPSWFFRWRDQLKRRGESICLSN